MKYYFARNRQIQLKTLPNFCEERNKYRYQKLALEILPFEDETKECLLLKSLLEAYKNEVQSQSFWNIVFVIAVSSVKGPSLIPGDFCQGFVELGTNATESGNVLEALINFWGDEVKVKVEFDVIDESNGSKCTFTSKEMEIQAFPLSCKDTTILFPCEHFWNFDMQASLWSANVTIIVSLPNELIENGRAVSDKCQKILCEKILSDPLIVTEYRLINQAHKYFFTTRSSIFKAMFRAFIIDSIGMSIQFDDITGYHVENFLKDILLYHTDKKFREGDCQLLFELLYAAHYYHVIELERGIKKIILTKPRDWYDVKIAEEMLKLANNMTSEGEELKIHAMEALQMHRRKVEASSPATPQPVKKDGKRCKIL